MRMRETAAEEARIAAATRRTAELQAMRESRQSEHKRMKRYPRLHTKSDFFALIAP